uniref:N-acyl-aliphatic-L-amino acid amidohydrolase n=1 Tax=Phallusia mammillata TaxID=59560 RepID=A0A6F9D590_9ASCI|nr:aminoacylase-1 [Phallusia mammillata]
MEPHSVSKFREYIRIKTVHPNPDYDSAVIFLDDYAKDVGLDVQHVDVGDENNKNTVVIMTWKGQNSNLKSVLLNSHTDVVPVYEDHWKCDAFAAFKDENGDIYGRGTQDMKCVGIQYLEAIKRLKKEGKQFERDIHLTFMPDEEVPSNCGAGAFFEMQEFFDLNVGVALDEGLANPGNKYSVFYAERNVWWVRILSKGNTGNGISFIENTAAEKLMKVINRMLNFREEEKQKLEYNDDLYLGDATTVNLTILEGGNSENTVPGELSAIFDIRIPPTVDLQLFEKTIADWCKEAGKDVSYEFIQKWETSNITSTNPDDPWWKAFTNGCKKMDVELVPQVFSAATDSCYLRKAGYPAIGFSPMRNTPILLHDHNEFLNEKVFLEGIDTYCEIIPQLANVPKF